MSDDQTLVHFKTWKCVPIIRHYSNGAIAVQLVHHEEGDPIATATVNIPDTILPEGDILIKNWSENAGIYQALYSAGYIGTVKDRIPTGYVHALQVSMTDKLRNLIPNDNQYQETA